MSIHSSLHRPGDVLFGSLKLGCMLANYQETGLMGVPSGKADAAIQVLSQAQAEPKRWKHSLGAKACCCSLLGGLKCKGSTGESFGDARVIRWIQYSIITLKPYKNVYTTSVEKYSLIT